MRIALSGCFDLFHDGHKYLLISAWALVAKTTDPSSSICIYINSDESIKELKGKDRPIDSLNERVLAVKNFLSKELGLREKHNFFIFSFHTENTLLKLYREHQPDLIIHGDDIKDISKATGYGEFNYKLIKRLPNMSTTGIIAKLKPVHYIASNSSEYNSAGILGIPTEIENKVWGTEELLHNDRYCIKIMTLKPKHQVSMHWHSMKTETFILIKGTLVIETINTQTAEKNITILTQPFSSFTLEPDVPHTFYTEDEEDVVFIEGSTYDDPLDSYRLYPSRRRE
jgi:glycerol-3-phosphate cytidylyltransferase-like family protein/quercetin dioxygenase-like cupin family protein